MSFLSTLGAIGTAIEAGIAVAAPIVGQFNPSVGTILAEIAVTIAALEKAATPAAPVSDQAIAAVAQATSTLSTIKQAATAPAASPPTSA